MSKSKKDTTFNSILKEYRRMKGKTSGNIGLSRKIMEITTAGEKVSMAELQDICIICDTRDLCQTCDWSDFNCSGIDGICITSDGCDAFDWPPAY
jgi:hypothetical protein